MVEVSKITKKALNDTEFGDVLFINSSFNLKHFCRFEHIVPMLRDEFKILK